MKNVTCLSVAGVVCSLVAAAVYGQQKVTLGPAKKTISIDQPIEEAKQILKDHSIEFNGGGFAFVQGKDATNLIVIIDKSSTYVALHYSKSKNTITAISMVYFPTGNHGKATQTWIGAKSMTFEADGSYHVHFLPPRKDVPAAQKR